MALFTRHKLTRVEPGLKLTQVVFTRHFSKLTRVEPGLVVFTRQTNPGLEPGLAVFTWQKLTRLSFNPGRTRDSLYSVNRAYVARHNRIVKLIGEQIAADKLDFKIHCDKIAKPEMFVNESEISDIGLFHFNGSTTGRPDLLLVNKAKKNAFIVEFSVPFD